MAGFQYWKITTLSQTVISIDSVPVGMTIAQLKNNDPNWETHVCQNGKIFLFNATLTSEAIVIDFSTDEEKIGVIIGSGTRPSCTL